MIKGRREWFMSTASLYIQQENDRYTAEQHATWMRLIERVRPRWEQFANPYFLHGIDALQLPPDRIPRLSDINRQLQPLTGFQARAVSGYVPGFVFFDC